MIAIDKFMVDPSCTKSLSMVHTFLMEDLRARRADLFVAQVRAKIAHQQALAILENRKGN